jgi:hypothetical protein
MTLHFYTKNGSAGLINISSHSLFSRLDRGADAHSHVQVCAGRTAGHPGNFGEFKQFEAAQNQMPLSKLQDRHRGMLDGDRKVAIASIQGDLADLGISKQCRSVYT